MCIRDRDYTANHHGTDSDNLDMIKGTYTVMSGNTVEYKELLNYVKIHDLTVQENYEYICSVVDVQEMMNWWIVESFFNNTDTGNLSLIHILQKRMLRAFPSMRQSTDAETANAWRDVLHIRSKREEAAEKKEHTERD